MKKWNIITIVVCIATSIICTVLTFWGNWKNDGILTTDAFIGVLATFIGICATIIVGFQIASFVKIHETGRQIKEVKKERDNMLEEKKKFSEDMNQVKKELSNSFYVLSCDSSDVKSKIIFMITSISLMNVEDNPGIALSKYQKLKKLITENLSNNISILSKFVDKLKIVNIPSNIDKYTEIMRLHFEIIDIIEKKVKEKTEK